VTAPGVVRSGDLAGLLRVRDGAADHQDWLAHATPYSSSFYTNGARR
jgi:hypothetical protein